MPINKIKTCKDYLSSGSDKIVVVVIVVVVVVVVLVAVANSYLVATC